MKEEKSKAGRHSKYPTHVQPYLEIIRAWRRRGLIEEVIAEKLGVGYSSLSEYKNEYAELREVLKNGLDEGVAEVENVHYKTAFGFEYEERKLIYDVDETGKPHQKPSRLEVIKKQALPNVAAQIFILKNRAGWHDKQEIVGAFAHALYDGKSTEELQAEAQRLEGILRDAPKEG